MRRFRGSQEVGPRTPDVESGLCHGWGQTALSTVKNSVAGIVVVGDRAVSPRPQAVARQGARSAVIALLLLFCLAGAFGQPSADYRALKFPPLREVKVPEPVFFTLANGMRVFLLEDHELPLISGSAMVRTGNLFDPSDKRGLADLTGSTMRSGGTRLKSGDALDEELESVAASVEASIGESNGSLAFSCLKENADQVMAIFRDVLTQPEFRQDKVDLAKTQARSGISRRNDDAAGIASREFASTVYGRETPWGWTIEYEHIDRIERADMVRFHERYFFPKNVIVAIYGDFSAVAMKAKLTSLFGGWTAEQLPVPPFPAMERVKHPGIFLAERDDVTQTFFEIGHLGGLLNEKDYPALQVAANILGSGFSSRLVQMVRTKLGYAYAVSAGWGAGYASPGAFQINGSTKSASTTDTIRVIRHEVEKMRAAQVTAEELKIAKDSVLNSFVFSFDRPSKTLNRMVVYEYFGYPKDFLFQYQKAVERVTAEDVLLVAKERFRPEDFTIVAVGNPTEFGKDALTALKIPVQNIDLTIPKPKAAASAPAPGTLLKRAQDAMGGRARLAAVRDLESSAEVKFQMGATMAPAKQRAKRIYPDTLRQEQELPFGNVIVFSDGKGGWMQTPQGMMALPPAVMQQVRGEMFRNLVSLLLSDGVAGRTVTPVDGGAVEITDGPDKVRLTFDASTELPAKLSYMTSPMTGAPVEVVETYSGWKAVNEVMLPFEYVIDQAGKRFAEGKITSYRVNSGLKIEDLSKKP